jgi:endonuclease/exonuclease/phosphatase (EEP) superfamily protein YafD
MKRNKVVCMKKIFSYSFISLSIFLGITTVILAYLPLNNGTWQESFALLVLNGLLFVHLFIFGIAICMRSFFALFPLLVMMLCYQSIQVIFAFNFPAHESEKTADLSVLSYNIASFNINRFQDIDSTNIAGEQIQWINKQTADIICFQEFYNDDNKEAEQTYLQLNNYYSYTNPTFLDKHSGFFGVAIFSRYPFVGYGNITLDTTQLTLNKAVYADVVIKNDTLRILNMHLESMSIRFAPLINSKSWDEFLQQTEDIYSKLKIGFEKRKQQIDIILNFIEKSPYKIILCGDFNDVPLSYTYRRMKEKLNNSFEKVGFGFGFTCNRRPYFIRIDHQFYSKGIIPISSAVLRENTYSDHFPILSHYCLEK